MPARVLVYHDASLAGQDIPAAACADVVVQSKALVRHTRAVKYDIAVWSGARPPDDVAASEVFEREMRRRDELMDNGSSDQDQAVLSFAKSLARQWPVEEPEDELPWIEGTPEDEIVGNVLYFVVRDDPDMLVAAQVAELAHQHRLVAYDPIGLELLRPQPGPTAAAQPPAPKPAGALTRRALKSALLELASDPLTAAGYEHSEGMDGLAWRRTSADCFRVFELLVDTEWEELDVTIQIARLSRETWEKVRTRSDVEVDLEPSSSGDWPFFVSSAVDTVCEMSISRDKQSPLRDLVDPETNELRGLKEGLAELESATGDLNAETPDGRAVLGGILADEKWT